MDVPVEGSIVEFLADICVAGAVIGCLYLLAGAIALLWQGRQQQRSRSAQPVGVTLLKPLYGDEPGLAERLSTYCRQDYDAPVQIVFGVQDPADPALHAVNRLSPRRDDHVIDVKIDERSHGSNRKMSNVVNMHTLAKHPVLLLVDSDIEITSDFLSTIVSELQQPDVGIVTCLYHGVSGQGIWSQLSRLAINTHFLPNAAAAIRLGLARPCFGSTIAMRRETLQRIGGFKAFSDCLADDHAIGVAVRAAGYKIAIPAATVGHACDKASLSDLIVNDMRCARTIKVVDPLGHFGTIMSHPLPLALIGAALGSVDALLLAGIALACRITICACVERVLGLERHPYWLVPIRDILSFGVFVASFFGSTVNWRGYRYRVMSDGTLVGDTSIQP